MGRTDRPMAPRWHCLLALIIICSVYMFKCTGFTAISNNQYSFISREVLSTKDRSISLLMAKPERQDGQEEVASETPFNEQNFFQKLNTLYQIYFKNALKKSKGPEDRQFSLFTGLPLKPYNERITIRTELVKDKIWGFEQEQGFFNVSVNTRMTAIKLNDGGLWVHAPVAPTGECLRLLRELDGPVRHLVLPTTALEHKLFMGPMSKKFPDAEVWVCPGQWSFPVNLPLNFKVSGFLEQGRTFPWSDEIEFELLAPPKVGIGPANEVAFFHRATGSLLVTDSLVSIPTAPPAVIPDQALAESAVEEGEAPPTIVDQAVRNKGWSKMALQILFFGPANPKTFDLLSNKLLVAPVSRSLVFERVPESIVDWIDRVTRWPIKQLIPCHFSAPVKATPQQIRDAYAFAYALAPERIGEEEEKKGRQPGGSFLGGLFGGGRGGGTRAAPLMFPEDDMATINQVKQFVE